MSLDDCPFSKRAHDKLHKGEVNPTVTVTEYLPFYLHFGSRSCRQDLIKHSAVAVIDNDSLRFTTTISARSEEHYSAQRPWYVGPVTTVLNNKNADLCLSLRATSYPL
ncbi:hypothetical protein EDD21DRAFT_350543 [Dissophora ornata]|nr:hypothetical protein EDD21DRAFT_350543 [Dissophora ornata]